MRRVFAVAFLVVLAALFVFCAVVYTDHTIRSAENAASGPLLSLENCVLRVDLFGQEFCVDFSFLCEFFSKFRYFSMRPCPFARFLL